VAGSGVVPELVAQYNADGIPVCQKTVTAISNKEMENNGENIVYTAA
jgi:hypothetical protein